MFDVQRGVLQRVSQGIFGEGFKRKMPNISKGHFEPYYNQPQPTMLRLSQAVLLGRTQLIFYEPVSLNLEPQTRS
ncbi:hypothetical protein [Pectobacterium phage Wc4-1]|uniref:Uncharacterized protein n=1 Tax=Pectobacterium phage Wc4 TaxID=2652428 RepID=A0A5P8D411_9CAUD|nr:hypothetical protein [Pectobacterium phage Wc4]QFP93933.1 hypothetical protein [Pectobacterium phage Wc4-1]